MVSGFFTSPCDHSRIFSGLASEMRIALNDSGSLGFSKKLKISFTISPCSLLADAAERLDVVDPRVAVVAAPCRRRPGTLGVPADELYLHGAVVTVEIGGHLVHDLGRRLLQHVRESGRAVGHLIRGLAVAAAHPEVRGPLHREREVVRLELLDRTV